jgi:hypothetical protein
MSKKQKYSTPKRARTSSKKLGFLDYLFKKDAACPIKFGVICFTLVVIVLGTVWIISDTGLWPFLLAGGWIKDGAEWIKGKFIQ